MPEGRWAALEKYDLFHEALRASSAANPVRLAAVGLIAVSQFHTGRGLTEHMVLLLIGKAAVDVACLCCWQDARYNPVRAVLEAVPPRGAQKYDMIQVRMVEPRCC